MAKKKTVGRPKKTGTDETRQMNVKVPGYLMDQLEDKLKLQSFSSYVRILIDNDLKQVPQQQA